MEHDYPKLTKKLSDETIALFNTFIKNKKISTEIELGLTKFTKSYCGAEGNSCYPVYIDKRTDLIANMDTKSGVNNTQFIENIKKKKLKYNGETITKYSDIAFLKPHELFPEKWTMEINRKSIREEKAKNIATSDMYPCRNCGARKAIVSPPRQLRSADEPMTTYVTCLVCSKVFKL